MSAGTEAEELLAAKAKFTILAFFKFDHLAPHLQAISAPFAALAYEVAIRGLTSKHTAEVVAGLRKLLEAKDCAVRAVLP